MVKPDVLESVSDRMLDAAMKSSPAEVVSLFEKITGEVERPPLQGQPDAVKADALVRFINEDAELQHYSRQDDRSMRQLVRLAAKKYHGRYNAGGYRWSDVFMESAVGQAVQKLQK